SSRPYPPQSRCCYQTPRGPRHASSAVSFALRSLGVGHQLKVRGIFSTDPGGVPAPLEGMRSIGRFASIVEVHRSLTTDDGAGSSTTLLDPQVNLLQFLDAFEIVRLLSKQQRRENLLDDRSNAGKRQRRVRAESHPLSLEECVGDGAEHHVMLPPGIRAAFEMVEAKLGLELLILLLDRTALMREPCQLLDRRRGRQVDEEVFDARGGAQILFAQEP